MGPRVPLQQGRGIECDLVVGWAEERCTSACGKQRESHVVVVFCCRCTGTVLQYCIDLFDVGIYHAERKVVAC